METEKIISNLNATIEELKMNIRKSEEDFKEKTIALEDVNKREALLRSQIIKADTLHKEDLQKLESAVKTAKKTATQQVNELSQRLKTTSDELEATKVIKIPYYLIF